MKRLFDDNKMLDREKYRESPQYWEHSSTKGIVTTAHYRATEIGTEILSQGGNAIDAAVAASLALGVAEPAGSGLGGMTMMMIHFGSSRKTIVLDGPCRAPRSATPDEFFRLANTYKQNNPEKGATLSEEELAGVVRKSGYPSVAVPTNAAVLGYAHTKFGTLSRHQVIEPVISLAEEGYAITPLQARLLKEYRSAIIKGNIASTFLGNTSGNNTEGSNSGMCIQQPALANTLRRIAKVGFEDFYTGEIGKAISADMKVNNGFITQEDLNNIPWPQERFPVFSRFKDWQILGMPPPGGGVALIEMLNLFERLVKPDFDPDSPEAAVLFSTIIRQARRDRRIYNLGEFTKSGEKVPDLTSKEYAEKIAVELAKELKGCGETSHLNVIDRFGNIVSLTQSVERSFGAKVATPELGFIYNGFMKGFKLRNKRHPHYLRPGGVARSNACPTIVFQDGTARYAIGSTGSERMVSGIFQVLVRLLTQSPFNAVAAPRLHCTPESVVYLEAGRFSPRTLQLLQDYNFAINRYDDWAFSVGGLHIAGITAGDYWGVAEPRRDGAALGP